MARRADGLTDKQAKFAYEYLKDLNGSAAAIRAGFPEKSSRALAAEYLAKPNIAAFIEAAREDAAVAANVTVSRVLRELFRLATVDLSGAYDDNGRLLPIKQMPEDVRRAIAGVEVQELFEGRGEDREKIGDLVKVKFWDKNKALEMLGRHLAMFVDRFAVDDPDGILAKLLGVNREDVPARLGQESEAPPN